MQNKIISLILEADWIPENDKDQLVREADWIQSKVKNGDLKTAIQKHYKQMVKAREEFDSRPDLY